MMTSEDFPLQLSSEKAIQEAQAIFQGVIL